MVMLYHHPTPGPLSSAAHVLQEASYETSKRAREKHGENMGEDRISWTLTEYLDGKLSEKSIDSEMEVYTHKFKDDSTNSPETVTGADLAVSIGILTAEEKWGSGIIAQAKSRPKHTTPPVEDFQNCCEKMLSYSPSSYCLMYRESGINLYPARAVSELDSSRFSHRNADELYERLPTMRWSSVLHLLATGFIGDGWIYDNFESIVNPIKNPISHRGVAMDGGNQFDDIENPNMSALLILFVDKEYEAEHIEDENFPFDGTPFSSDGPFSELSKV